MIEQSLHKELAKSPLAALITVSFTYVAVVSLLKPVEWEVTISLASVLDAPDAVKAGNARAMKEFVTQAFFAVQELATVRLHGVRLLAD